MAIATQERVAFAALRRRLYKLRTSGGATTELFVKAMEGYLTAAGYKDEALMRSHFQAAREVLSEHFADSIEQMVGDARGVRAEIQKELSHLEGLPIVPGSDFDDCGRAFAEVVEGELWRLSTFRDGPLALITKHEAEVPNAAALHEEIARWQSIKENIIDCWPWTDAPLPPVDREMVAESRRAHQRGEQAESIDALIQRLKSN